MRDKLSIGIRVLVYPHLGGAPIYADLTLMYPFTCLTLYKETRQKEIIVIDDISEIRPYTEQSFTFREMHIPKYCEGTNHLFTIIASEKSISMAADTPENCIFLVKGLKLLLEYAIPSHIKKTRHKDNFSEDKLYKIMTHIPTDSEIELGEKVKFKLKQGMDVLYVTNKNSKFKERILILDITEKRLLLLHRRYDDITTQLSVLDSILMYFEGPTIGIDIDDIAEIRPGYTSAIFSKIEPPPSPDHEHLAFSLVGSERSIAIQMRNEEERSFISTDFQSWLHMMRMSSTLY
jgi:hypothetical protein